MQKGWILEENVSSLFLLDLFLHIPVYLCIWKVAASGGRGDCGSDEKTK